MQNINDKSQSIYQEKYPQATVKECFNKYAHAMWIVYILQDLRDMHCQNHNVLCSDDFTSDVLNLSRSSKGIDC